MKRIGRLVLILAVSLASLTGCGRPGQAANSGFDGLARWVSGEAEQVFFLDLKPEGEAGRHWERIRRQLEANPSGQEGLKALSQQLRVEEYGLDDFLVGPVVHWSYRVEYVVAQVSDEEAARDALLLHFEDIEWEQEEYQGRTLYHGMNRDSWRQRERMAWTVHDGLLFLCFRYDEDALTQLQELVSLAREDSLAALNSWRTLRERLPETPMGLMFFNVAAQARRYPPAPGDMSLGATLNQQLVAMAFAAVPEQEGMRVEIVGTLAPQEDAPPEFQALFSLPAIDPAAWPGLPADAAIALVGHDASVLWPWLEEMFGLDGLGRIRDTLGLDMETDLAGAEGPLASDFALAITPPLPEQPIIQEVPAAQLLILARGANEAQMAGVQAAMEGRGAVFGPGEVEGVALQTQVGTRPSGYAISYGFDDDTLLFGSSPDVIGQAVSARREGDGWVTTDTFQAMLAALPDDPSLVFYLNSGPLISMAQTNMTGEQYQNSQEYVLMEAFEAIGLGLRFQPGSLDGVAYFFASD